MDADNNDTLSTSLNTRRSIMSVNDDAHIVIVAYQAWGHTRPLCTLASRMIKLRAVNITFFTSRQMHTRVTKEVSRNFEDDEESQKSRLRIVGLHAHEQDIFDVETVGQSFSTEFQNLVTGKPARCAKTNSDVHPLKPPSVLLVDIFGRSFMRIARSQHPMLKVFTWMPGSLVSFNGLFGPFKPDSAGELQRKVEEIMAQSGKPLMEAAQAVMSSPTEEVMHVSGLPPVFAYENFPQEPCFKIPIAGLLHLEAHNLIQESDGCIAAALETLEPKETVQSIEDYLSATSRKLYVVGPLLPSTRNAAAIEMEQAVKTPEIKAFMDEALQSHGERSLVYISFGTLFWTTQPEKIWMMLDVLIERKIPFILSHASPLSQIPLEVNERVQSSGLGVITTWAPQQTILGHPATGWFVTHSGFNSFTESIDAGVPMICWPFAADQPLNTIHLVENLDVAYELLEVRSGDGLRPIYRTGKSVQGTLEALRTEVHDILDRAFGEDGARKYANVQRLRAAGLSLWGDDGPARRATEQFLETICGGKDDMVAKASPVHPDTQPGKARSRSMQLFSSACRKLVPSNFLYYFKTAVGAVWGIQESTPESE